jgi:ribonuclease HIII
LKPCIVIKEVNDKNYNSIKELIQSSFLTTSKSRSNGIKDTFEVRHEKKKVSFTYYENKKLMIQSNPNNSIYIELINIVSKIVPIEIEKDTKQLPVEDNLNYKFHIGCDEAGVGETFGSMFLGCALISNNNLKKIDNLIKHKNIRLLDHYEVNRLLDKTRNKFRFIIKQYTPNEIDSDSKIVLLDKGYIELISKIINKISSSVIIVDDYGASKELRTYLFKLTIKGHKIIVKHSADEEYTACKLASLVSRYSRLNELDDINRKYRLVDNMKNCDLIPGAGSPSNSQTIRYLVEYRKQYPFSNFPSFVRKKWKNVQEIENKYPKRNMFINSDLY